MAEPIRRNHQTPGGEKGSNDNQPKAKEITDPGEKAAKKIEDTQPGLEPASDSPEQPGDEVEREDEQEKLENQNNSACRAPEQPDQ